MTWYAIYQTEDGRYVSGTSDVTKVASADVLTARGYAVKQFADGSQNGPWDPIGLVFGPIPANPSIISIADFLRRFTPTELAGIQASTDITVQQHLTVLKVMPGLMIDLNDAHTTAMLTYLVTHGLLTSARATAIGTP